MMRVKGIGLDRDHWRIYLDLPINQSAASYSTSQAGRGTSNTRIEHMYDRGFQNITRISCNFAPLLFTH